MRRDDRGSRRWTTRSRSRRSSSRSRSATRPAPPWRTTAEPEPFGTTTATPATSRHCLSRTRHRSSKEGTAEFLGDAQRGGRARGHRGLRDGGRDGEKASLDYASTAGTLRIEPGDTARAIRVPTLDDESLEQTEDFTVTLSGPAGGDAGRRGRQGDDHRRRRGQAARAGHRRCTPRHRGRVGQVPGDAERAERAGGDRGVHHGGTEPRRAGSDYVAADGTLTFEPGTTRRTIGVVTRQDELVESDEGFSVTLSDPTGAGLEDDNRDGQRSSTTTWWRVCRRWQLRTRRPCPRAVPPGSS